MDENERPTESGWDFPKVLGVILGIIGMIGFSLCTLCGLVIGSAYGGGVSSLALWGGVMTALSLWLIIAMVRKARQAREASTRTDP
jgi:hypothetical protein